MKPKLLLVFMLVVSFVHATKINVDNTTLIANLATANSGDTLLLANGTYSTQINFQSGKNLTLKSAGTGSVIFTATIGGAANDTGCGLTLDGIVINRGNQYVVDGSTFGNIDLIAFHNDTIINVNRCLIRGGNATPTNLTSIELTNCIVSNCGLNGYCFLYPKFNVSNVTIRNNTFIRYYGGESLFRPQVTNTSNVLNFTFENNTLFKWSKGSGYAICYSAAIQSTASNFTLRNNIFAEPGVVGQAPKLLVATGGNIIEKNNLSVNYGRIALTAPVSADTTVTPMSYNIYDPAIGFQDTTQTKTVMNVAGVSIPFGDFHILSTSPLAKASTTGGIIGDPRWLWLKTITAVDQLNSDLKITGYRSGNVINLQQVPVKSTIMVYTLNGSTISQVQTQSSNVTISVNVPCIVRVISNKTTSALKIM